MNFRFKIKNHRELKKFLYMYKNLEENLEEEIQNYIKDSDLPANTEYILNIKKELDYYRQLYISKLQELHNLDQFTLYGCIIGIIVGSVIGVLIGNFI